MKFGPCQCFASWNIGHSASPAYIRLSRRICTSLFHCYPSKLLYPKSIRGKQCLLFFLFFAGWRVCWIMELRFWNAEVIIWAQVIWLYCLYLSVNIICYRLHACVSPKFIRWKPNSQWDGIRVWGLLKVIKYRRSWGLSFQDGINIFIRRERDESLLSWPCEGTVKRQLSTSQKAGPPQPIDLPDLRIGLGFPILQNGER